MSPQNDPGFLVWIGVKLPDLVAGFLGGVVNAFVRKRSDPLSILGALIVGALTANYLAEPFSHFLSHMIGDINTGVSGFIVGVAGMTIVQGILEASKLWRPFGSNSSKPGGNGNA